MTAIGICVIALVTGETALAVPGASQAAQVTTLRHQAAQVTTLRHAALQSAASPVKHIVVLYMENHSFDNVLGFWCDKPAQVAANRCPDGGMPASVKLSNGAVVVPTTDPDTVPNEDHNVAAQLRAMNIQGGVPKMNGWENISGCTPAMSPPDGCVSGYQPSQIPNTTSLATQFAISDRTFSMGDSSSWGGNLYVAVASLDGFLGNNPRIPGTSGGQGW